VRDFPGEEELRAGKKEKKNILRTVASNLRRK
jgi:hypothetical protein